MMSALFEKQIADIGKVILRTTEDESVANLFRHIANSIVQSHRERDSDLHDTSVGEIIKDFPKDNAVRMIEEQSTSNGFNLIPSDKMGPCHKVCVSIAFNKWKSRKGFCGIADRTIELWLKCANINQTTLILTTAWDQAEFNAGYRSKFVSYAKGGHRTFVILVGNLGFSIQFYA